MSKKVIIVDADTLIFSAASVTEQRYVDILHKPTGVVKTFNNRTEFKELMKSKGKEISEDYKISDRQESEDIANCLHLIKYSANSILDRFAFEDVIFCAGDEDNFRLNLPLPTRYKDFRKDTIRPIHLKESYEYFRSKFKAKKAKGYEADDLVTILANEAISKGKEAVILSKDKDKRQSIGVFVGEYESNYDNLIYVQDMHNVEFTTSKFKSYGIPWIAFQCLVGDSIDGYKPSKLAGVKYGDASAYKDLKNCQTPKEVLIVIKDKYKQWYPEVFEYTSWDGTKHRTDWKSMLQLYYSCCRMKRTHDDCLSVEEFFDEYNVCL